MKSRLLSIASLILFASVLLFNNVNIHAAENLPSGVSEEEIGQIIDNYIAENEDTTAAVSIEVFRGNDILYSKNHGLSNIEDNLPATQDTVYEWGSVTKLLVWVSVMQLVETNQLDLDTDIKTYLPADFIEELSYKQPITLTNLMNHDAGFEDSMFENAAENESGLLSLKDALLITEPDQVYEPGEVTAYSNWTTALAGYIVEVVSGQYFYDYVQEHIFHQLNMTQTSIQPGYVDNPFVRESLLAQEGYDSDLEPIGDGLYFLNLYPAGSAAGTLEDLTTFAQALIPNSSGSQKLFSNSETAVTLLEPTDMYTGTDISKNNHGFWSHEYEVQALGHGGNTNMYSSYLLIDPISEIGLVIMTNQASEFIYNYNLPPLIYGELGAMVAEDSNSHSEEVAGNYYPARIVRNGIGKMEVLTNLSFYQLSNETDLASNFLGMNVQLNQIAPNTFIMSQSVGDQSISFLTRYSEATGTKRLEMTVSDNLEMNTDIYSSLIATILYFIAFFWSLGLIIFNLFNTIFRRNRTKDSFNKYQIFVGLAIVIHFFNVIFLINKMVSEASLASIYPHVILSIVLAIIPIVYGIQMIHSWSKMTTHKWGKASYATTSVMGIFLTIFIVVLEMYYV